MPQSHSQYALATNASNAPGDGRKLLEEFYNYKGIVLRGWRFIAICVVATLSIAIIFLVAQKPTYRSFSSLLLIQQSAHAVQVGGVGDPLSTIDDSGESTLATHLLLLKSPVIMDQALKLKELKSVSAGAAIDNLTVKQPDVDAKIVDLTYKSNSPEEARLVLEGVIESYKLFLKANYQKNSSDVMGLIIKARNELNAELKSLEQAYLEYRQKNPAYSADSTGHTFVARRLDQWDRALNQFSARALQLQSQLALGKKMSREGVDPASIANALSQVGSIATDAQSTATAPIAPALPATNDGSYVGIAKELAEVESRRKMAELFLEHLGHERQNSAIVVEISEREIESAFLADPDVAALVAKVAAMTAELKKTRRAARSATDPAIQTYDGRLVDLRERYERLWEAKRPMIVKSLTTLNPDLDARHRTAEAEVVELKARESALNDRLVEVADEELQQLRRQRDQLIGQHGEKHLLVAQLKQRIAGIESRQQQSVGAPGGGNNSALIDYMAQSLQSIEAMRSDLQEKFEADLALSKKAEITFLEESNLKSNLERQRTLFYSVVDQLKQARLFSDYDTLSTQMIAPITVAADKPPRYRFLILALIAGVGLGLGVAYVVDLAEAKVRTLTEIRKSVDHPLIGVIPFMKDDQIAAFGTAGLLSHHLPQSALAESYRTTRTNLEFLRRSRHAQTLMIASALPGDGKTTTVCNLAIALAKAGRRVLLIDGDLRKPALHRVFEVVRQGGLSEVLLSIESCDQVIRQTCVDNLELMTTGREISNPSELLASERLGEVLKELRSNYDIILIDSPPLLLITDPCIISSVVDGMILVVKISSTRRRDIDVTNDVLKNLGVPVYGVVANGVTREEFGYGYGYGYGAYYYGGYGYGKLTGPYGAPEEPRINGHRALPHDDRPGIGTNGKQPHENRTADSV